MDCSFCEDEIPAFGADSMMTHWSKCGEDYIDNTLPELWRDRLYENDHILRGYRLRAYPDLMFTRENWIPFKKVSHGTLNLEDL